MTRGQPEGGAASDASAGSARNPWLVWLPGPLFFSFSFFQRTAPGVMADDLMRDFDVGAALLGNLAAFYFYGYASIQLVAGMLLDRWGPRRVIAAAALVAATGVAIFAGAEDLVAAYLGRLLIGAGVGFAWLGTLKIVALWFPLRRFALIGGLSTMFGMFGAMLGQAPLAALIDRIGWRPALLGSAAAGVACSLLVWLFVRDGPAEPRRGRGGFLRGLRRAGSNPQTWIIALYAGTVIMPFNALAALWGVPFIMQAQGLARGPAALVVSMMLLGQAVGGPSLGWLSDRMGRRRPTMGLCAGLSLATYVPIIGAPDMPLVFMYVLFFLAGVFSTGIIIGFAAGREANALEVSGVTSGIINTAVMAGGAFIQPAIGLLMDAFWDGRIEAGLRVYSLETFQLAFLILPAVLALSLMTVPLVREGGKTSRTWE